MTINIKNFTAKFKIKLNPKAGLIALSTDQTIEQDFNNICKNPHFWNSYFRFFFFSF